MKRLVKYQQLVTVPAKSAPQSVASIASEKSECEHCGKHHGEDLCSTKARRCLKCGSLDHRIRECSKLKTFVPRGVPVAARPQAPARVYALARDDANDITTDDAVAGMRDILREHRGCAMIDGGLAMELEANDADLNDPLWSAKCLVDSPHLIRKVHLDYLEADDVHISSSLAVPPKKRSILIAASVGSYGAYLVDGSEYSGDYETGADLIAFETIPNKLEAQAYAELLEENDIKIPAWFSFNSKDGINVVSGDSMLECISIADSCRKVAAVGINCTPPTFIHGFLLSISKAGVAGQRLISSEPFAETLDRQCAV
ncbi:hypothetical protein Taro_020954 [Colocasia esculenta]|uniref:Hcy-binding domain-containing protein n=1 Tax=Colocasia esculenta TaxID=4460 RepID=A0A843UXP4_COLES|nr:hypothetical protein [Colocasia esculenta]